MRSIQSKHGHNIAMAACLVFVFAVAAHAQVPGIGGIGGDPTATFLQRVVQWLVGLPGRSIVVIGIGFFFLKLMFGERHNYAGAFGVLLGGVGLIFLQTMVSYWIG